MLEVNRIKWKGLDVMYAYDSSVKEPQKGWYNELSMFMGAYKVISIKFRGKETSLAYMHRYPKLLRGMVKKIICNVLSE